MSSSNPNYRPYFGSMMSYSSQAPPYYSSTPMENENVPLVELDEFLEFSTQVTLGAMSSGQGATPNAEDSTPVRRKSPKWTTDQNLVLMSEKAPNDVLAKARELYSSGKSGHFLLIHVGKNIGSGSSGSKRVHESDASDSNSVGSSARPMGRDAAKKRVKKSKGAALESINEEWNEYKQFKEKELERLDKIAMRQEEANQLLKENIEAKKMKMFMKLSSKDHLDDQSKELLEKLGKDLFGN
ncbi:uncharacterized protein LOC131628088 [Vicia villosa]|uniref:uncharacterized protein LOC131628088 n=1 Tax=Vicia villosa TaxID=3911 RepID=UPI00273BAD18|nr:uncharacterized protein LOC131628088 [Vicia villosa]